METFLALCLIAAVYYIVYLQQQPKTDAERAKHEARKQKMAEVRAIQAEKDRRKQADGQ